VPKKKKFSKVIKKLGMPYHWSGKRQKTTCLNARLLRAGSIDKRFTAPETDGQVQQPLKSNLFYK